MAIPKQKSIKEIHQDVVSEARSTLSYLEQFLSKQVVVSLNDSTQIKGRCYQVGTYDLRISNGTKKITIHMNDVKDIQIGSANNS